jgi:hypothetical protein
MRFMIGQLCATRSRVERAREAIRTTALALPR